MEMILVLGVPHEPDPAAALDWMRGPIIRAVLTANAVPLVILALGHTSLSFAGAALGLVFLAFHQERKLDIVIHTAVGCFLSVGLDAIPTARLMVIIVYYSLILHGALSFTSWWLVLADVGILYLSLFAGLAGSASQAIILSDHAFGFLMQGVVGKGMVSGWSNLSRATTRLKRTLHLSPDIIATIGLDGTFREVNPATMPSLGYEPEELVGANLVSLVHPEDRDHTIQILAAVPRKCSADFQSRVIRKDGTSAWFEWKATLLEGEGVLFCIARDITERKEFEDQLSHLAFHDTLTDLPNRALFAERLKHALASAVRRKSTVALLFLDLDSFKAINDTLGHNAGDALLIQLAARLRPCVRNEDTLARFAGDEFTVLLEEVADVDEAVTVARRIGAILHEPFSVNGTELYMTSSIGIALSSQGECGFEALLSRADAAMYHAKAAKMPFVVWDPGMDHHAWERLQLRSQLAGAIEREEFRLHYQPIVNLGTGRIVGTEALIRWAHPERGLLLPEEFLPVAEEAGLLVPIESWVLHEACRQMREWRSASPELDLFVSVNLSARFLLGASLVSEVDGALRQSGLAPQALQLEILEGEALGTDESLIRALRDLAGKGVKLAIDDFGTGYSTMHYIDRFPISTLKLDRSFVAGADTPGTGLTMLEAIVAFAKRLDLCVIVEGIEREQQAAELRRLQCCLGQGFYFARPLPPDAAGSLFTNPGPGRATLREQPA